MSDRQIINHGQAANDGTGEGQFSSWTKVNSNFSQLWDGTATLPDPATWRASLKATTFVRTNAEMLAMPSSARQGVVQTLGYHSPSDRGGGAWYWDDTSTATDDGGLVLAINGATTGRWRRLIGGYVMPQMWGAKADGVADDSAAIQAAIDAAQAGKGAVYLPPGLYIVATTLQITQPIAFFGDNFTGRWDSSPNPTVGAQIHYTGTGTALNSATYRLNLHDIRFTSANNAAFGVKLKGEESYIERVNVGTNPGSGFQVGIYAENSSINTFRDCILSCNTVANMFLDCLTGACSSVQLDRMHFYRSPIGLRLTVSSDVHLSMAWFEACKIGIYADNSSSFNGVLQNISVHACHYLNNPEVDPFYQQGRFIKIEATGSNAMEVRGLSVRNNQVLNLEADYDVEGIFGSVVPTCERIVITENNFWGSGVAVLKSDCANFVPVIYSNSIASAAADLELPDSVSSAPLQLQGKAPSMVVGKPGLENAIRLVSGAQVGYPAFIQGGLSEADTQAQLVFSLLNTAAGRLAFAKFFAATLEQHGDLQIFDADDVVRLRLVANALDGKSYVQAGQGASDANGKLVLCRKDTSVGQLATLDAFADSSTINGTDINLNATTVEVGTGIHTDANTTASETRFLVYDISAGAFKRVKLASSSSIPSGKQLLYID